MDLSSSAIIVYSPSRPALISFDGCLFGLDQPGASAWLMGALYCCARPLLSVTWNAPSEESARRKVLSST